MVTGPLILLVDDEPLLRRGFRALLEAAGYEVREAGTAAEALEQATSAVPALVLLDLGLPDRDGVEVMKELRKAERTRDVVIVALTGRVGPGVARDCAAARCADLLIKPVSPRELLRRIPEWLGPGPTGARAGTPA